ncbi:MAG: hypothetical protein K940chlam2_00682, partial [Chlamydiae bacterium]|nr:hypothetical protein [Chlamydiota bacterium]
EPYIRPSEDSLYMGRWQVVWIIVKTPFVYIAAAFFRAISALLSVIQLTSASLFLKMSAIHLTRDNYQLGLQNQWGKRLLVPAINEPKVSSTDTYTRSSMPIAEAQSEKVRKLHISHDFFTDGINNGLTAFFHTISTKRSKEHCKAFKATLKSDGIDSAIQELRAHYKGDPKIEEAVGILYVHYQKQLADRAQMDADSVRLYREEGGCRGGSEWFATLFLMTQEAFEGKDIGAHLVAVAKQFETGYSSEAALLATFTQAQRLLGTQASLQKKEVLRPYELDKDEPACLAKLRALDAGIYCVGVPNHRLVYIKVDEKEGYLWNPNQGLIDLSGDDHQKLLLKEVKKTHVEGSFAATIYFEKMTLAKTAESDDLREVI